MFAAATIARWTMTTREATTSLLGSSPFFSYSSRNESTVKCFTIIRCSAACLSISNGSIDTPLVVKDRPWKIADAPLLLEDGSVWNAKSFGATWTQVGEVVFNTSLTGSSSKTRTMDEFREEVVKTTIDGQTDHVAVITLVLDGLVNWDVGILPSQHLLEKLKGLEHLSIANVGVSSLEGFPFIKTLRNLFSLNNVFSRS